MSNESLAERLSAKLYQLFVLLVLAFVVIGSFRPMLDNVDIGWHVAQGRWMIEHHAIYRHDALNYPNLGHPVIDECPFFQVVLYLFYTLGWWGPCLLTALAYFLLILVFIHAARAWQSGPSTLFALSLGLLLLYLQLVFPLRPHIATYLGVAILGTFLLRHRATQNWLTFWPMALLQVAWTNSHSGFVLGPIMVALFGVEIVLRDWLQTKTFPTHTCRIWFAIFLFILLACFLNPFGAARFYPPFYQTDLESIRAYVGEMEPLTGGLATIYQVVTLIAAGTLLLAFIPRCSLSWSFLLLAVLFYLQALDAKKAWPLFALFIPLLILSSTAFGRHSSSHTINRVANLLGLAAMASLMAFTLMLRLDGSAATSVQGAWRNYDQGRSELSVMAVAWMKANEIKGRFFHRCEDGGVLQQRGYDHGETFADTGFGKYDEAFIHEAGVVGERPALLPRYIEGYHPDFIVCGNFCFQWPYYLRQQGWHPIFYSPNSSVWAQTGTRPDLQPVSDSEIISAFDTDIATHGRPSDLSLYGRNLIALNSLGLEDIAFARLTSLPPELHHQAWYWEAARILSFENPPISVAHHQALLQEAEALNDPSLTADFRAFSAVAQGDTSGALKTLEQIPPSQLSNTAAELLLKIYLDQNRPEALALARRTDCWDLRNGRHWQYLAEAEEKNRNFAAAAVAWKKAIFYYPDAPILMKAASAFDQRHPEFDLEKTISQSHFLYGK